MDLDYTPLQKEITKAEIAAFQSTYNKGSNVPAVIIAVISLSVLLTLALLGTLAILFGATGAVAPLGAFGIFAMVALLVSGIGIWSTKDRMRKLAAMNAFAQHNGLTFLFDRKTTVYAGLIFQHGRNRSISESFVFPSGVEMGNYHYETGSGRSRRVHQWGYVRLKLPRKLPHMLLDAKKNNLLSGRISNLPATLKADQTMKLEGNFNDHFTLYAPKGYERDAYYVFTPDVMMALIDHGDQFDIEVIDDSVFLYSAGRLALEGEQSIRSLLAVAEKIGSEIHDQGDSYADERINDRAANSIAIPGRRLKKRVSVISVIVIVAISLYYFFEIIAPLIWSR